MPRPDDKAVFERLKQPYWDNAERNLQVAGYLKENEDFTNDAYYHVAQSAEMLVRSVAAADEKRLGNTHSFYNLADALGKDHPLYDDILLLYELGSASTNSRYPGTSGYMKKYGEKELDDAISLVSDFTTKCRTYILKTSLNFRP